MVVSVVAGLHLDGGWGSQATKVEASRPRWGGASVQRGRAGRERKSVQDFIVGLRGRFFTK